MASIDRPPRSGANLGPALEFCFEIVRIYVEADDREREQLDHGAAVAALDAIELELAESYRPVWRTDG
jgi:hypothetical protein